MSNNLFNKSRYFKLLQKENNDDLSESGFRELLSSQIILENQITYNKREKYISLLEEHIKEPLGADFEDFEDLETYLDSYSPMYEFSELFDQDLEDFHLLEKKILKEGITVLDNFSIDSISSSKEFSNEIRLILHLDDVDEEMSENDYRIFMESTLLRLRDCANRDSRIYKDNEVLQSVMIFFSSISVIAYSVLNPSLFSLIWQ